MCFCRNGDSGRTLRGARNGVASYRAARNSVPSYRAGRNSIPKYRAARNSVPSYRAGRNGVLSYHNNGKLASGWVHELRVTVVQCSSDN